MEEAGKVAEMFAAECGEILGDALTGVYLHGSLAMGCFHPLRSDIDLIAVVERELPDETKLRLMEMTVRLNALAPKKGIEMSVVPRQVCRPFVYPTPYLLHFSNTHLKRWQADPREYVRTMNGTDRDLAAHFTVITHRGVTLRGEEIEAVFGAVSREAYADSILYDVENAETEIAENPLYLTLNLCRALAFREEGSVLSKAEGGEWGLRRLPERYRPLIRAALRDYRGETVSYDGLPLGEYARWMLNALRG